MACAAKDIRRRRKGSASEPTVLQVPADRFLYPLRQRIVRAVMEFVLRGSNVAAPIALPQDAIFIAVERGRLS